MGKDGRFNWWPGTGQGGDVGWGEPCGTGRRHRAGMTQAEGRRRHKAGRRHQERRNRWEGTKQRDGGVAGHEVGAERGGSDTREEPGEEEAPRSRVGIW